MTIAELKQVVDLAFEKTPHAKVFVWANDKERDISQLEFKAFSYDLLITIEDIEKE